VERFAGTLLGASFELVLCPSDLFFY